MYRTANADIVYCPVCQVPHRSGATHCDTCSQPLHQPADLDALRGELSRLRRAMVLGLTAVAAMLGLNVFLGGRVGFLLIYAAPLTWLAKSAARYRAVRGWVARCETRSRQAG